MKTKLVNENYTQNYISSLLQTRGIEDMERFCNPTSDDLQSWRDLENIHKGINAILDKCLEAKPKIGMIVDCDCDGYTSATIMYQYLTTTILDPDSIHYYLHTGKQHGLEEHWQEMLEENFDLIIIPDASSNDSEYAKEFNCPILVIDHHQVEDEITADNLIVINNQLSPNYRNKYLSGASMCYQFCRALDNALTLNRADYFLDLAALGSIGDVMSSLEVENQYIWRKGLSNINNYFFQTLLRKQSYSICGEATEDLDKICETLTPMNVAFYVVPLINAMIRVGTQEEKERLFLAFINGYELVPCNKRGAKGTMEKVAIESARECTNARSHQNKDKEKMVEKLEQRIFKYDLLENKILFIELTDDDVFPSELNGLVCMALSQKYKRPTLIGRLNDEGFYRGSARGLSNTDMPPLKEYLASTNLFEYTVGHSGAFGHSIAASHLQQMLDKTNQELAQYDFNDDCYEVNFERTCKAADLNLLIMEIADYDFLWMNNNAEPLIHITDINLSKDNIQVIGKNKNTVKWNINGITYIKFFADDMIEELNNYDFVNLEIVGKANMNYWNGVAYPQIIIENYQIKDNLLEF